jgi:hypothetical protein
VAWERAYRRWAANPPGGLAGLDGTGQRDLFKRHVSGVDLQVARALLEQRGLAVTKSVPTSGRSRIVTTAVPLRSPLPEAGSLW